MNIGTAILIARKGKLAEIKDEVELGKVYRVDKDSVQEGVALDLDTGASFITSRVQALKEDNSPEGWLPLDMVKIVDEKELVN